MASSKLTSGWRSHGSIRTKLTAAILAAALAPLAFVGIVSFQGREAAAVDAAFSRLEGIANAQAGQLEAVLQADEDTIGVLTTAQEIRETLTDRTTSQNLPETFSRAFATIDGLSSIALLTPDGEFIAGTDPTPAAIDRVERILTQFPDGQYLGLVTRNSVDEPVTVSRALATERGEVIGIVVTERSLDRITELATDYTGLRETGETSVAQLDPDGNAQVIAPMRFADDAVLERVIPRAAVDAPITAAMAGREENFDDTVDYRDESVLAVTRFIDEANWGIVVKIDRSEALAEFHEFRTTLALAGLAALGMAVIGALLIGRLVSHPVTALTELATEIADGDLTRRAEQTRRDELGRLGHALNTMTDSLTAAARDEAERTRELEFLNQQLAANAATTRAIVDTAAEGIIHANEHGTVLEFNRAAEAIFDTPADRVLGTNVATLLSIDGSDDPEPLQAATTGGSSGMEMSARRPDGTTVPVHVVVSEMEVDGVHSTTALIRDVSERQAYERRLSHMATHDALTGLPNRELLRRRLDAALAVAHRDSSTIALLFIDLDRFKIVNDSWGHAAGDELLCQVSERLKGTLRDVDVVARFGGDEFVVLASELSSTATAVSLAERVLASIEAPFEVAGEETYISASIGIASTTGAQSTADDLVSDADVAMYRAKRSGRAAIEVFDTDMRMWVQARHELDTELRRAIEKRELALHYQPIVDAGTGDVLGVEALVRWVHPERGPISPAEFVPIAEESGLISELGSYVLTGVCQQMVRWDRDHPGHQLTYAINFSARELMAKDCVARVAETLRMTGADATQLVVEVTEGVLLHDADTAIANLHGLRDLGIQIALDDFGTGFSSLTYLRQLPVDKVKIDREFIEELTDGEEVNSSIVKMVIGLGEALDIEVIAEGVETDEQRRIYVEMGGRTAQGFHFHRPMPAERAEAALWPVAESVALLERS